MYKILMALVLAATLAACATTGNNRDDQREVVENTRGWCFLAPRYCDGILVIGAIAAVYAATKNGKKSRDNESANQPITPNPSPLDGRTRMIIDTDMGPRSDPDDIQTYLAQASDLDRWNVRGIVSTGRNAVGPSVPFIEGILRRLNNEVSTRYTQYPVVSDPQFYVDEIASAARDGVDLEIHVWGSILNLSAAVNRIQDKQSLSNVTVYWVANFNRVAFPEYRQAWTDMIPNVRHFRSFYRDEEGFRGIMRSGDRQQLVNLDRIMRDSRVGQIYADNPIPPADRAFTNRWKAGDLSLYFYTRNNVFRDMLFKPDQYGGFVADGIESERQVASRGFRDEMVRVVTENANRF